MATKEMRGLVIAEFRCNEVEPRAIVRPRDRL